MFSAVNFFHHLSNSAHGAPGGNYSTEQRKEDKDKISTNPTLGLMSEWPFSLHILRGNTSSPGKRISSSIPN